VVVVGDYQTAVPVPQNVELDHVDAEIHRSDEAVNGVSRRDGVRALVADPPVHVARRLQGLLALLGHANKLAVTVPRSVTAAVCAALLVAGAGCGQSDQEKARDVVQDYVDARGAQDYEAECDLYSESFKEELGATNCPAFVEEQTAGLDPGDLEIVSVRVNGDRAMAELDVAGESGAATRIGLVLERQDGDWLITGLQ
jgi:hypothetical protein